MAYRKTYPREREDSEAIRFSRFSPWRLIFADRYRRPISWAERRQLRFRAFFFVVVGVALTVAVQAWAKKSGWVCPP